MQRKCTYDVSDSVPKNNNNTKQIQNTYLLAFHHQDILFILNFTEYHDILSKPSPVSAQSLPARARSSRRARLSSGDYRMLFFVGVRYISVTQETGFEPATGADPPLISIRNVALITNSVFSCEFLCAVRTPQPLLLSSASLGKFS